MIPRSTALLDQATVLAGSCLLRHQTSRINLKPRKTASCWVRLAFSAQAMSGDLWAFDFDGVVCNSVGESSKSAWKVRRQSSLSMLNATREAAGGSNGAICAGISKGMARAVQQA